MYELGGIQSEVNIGEEVQIGFIFIMIKLIMIEPKRIIEFFSNYPDIWGKVVRISSVIDVISPSVTRVCEFVLFNIYRVEPLFCELKVSLAIFTKIRLGLQRYGQKLLIITPLVDLFLGFALYAPIFLFIRESRLVTRTKPESEVRAVHSIDLIVARSLHLDSFIMSIIAYEVLFLVPNIIVVETGFKLFLREIIFAALME